MSNGDRNYQGISNDHDVIYALRTAHQNQTQLVVLADQKANILIGVLAIIFTIILTNTNFITGIEQSFLIPFAGFLLLEIIAVLMAFLVVLPKNIKRHKDLKLDDVANPLFFGIYTEFGQDDYVQHLLGKIHDNHSARAYLLTDYYQTGVVLRKKYTLLKYAYSFAVAGFLLLIVASGYYLL
jgi:hypothetical protein